MTDLTAARVLCDSTYLNGQRIVTAEATFPRFVLAEFNTHKAPSRNSASSRAIPVEKQLLSVSTQPFVPKRWPVNRPGMSAAEFYEPGSPEFARAELVWTKALGAATSAARELHAMGVHKQIANRLIEPFMWHTAIATATIRAWDAMFELRISPHAQPEINDAFAAIRDAIANSQPATLQWWQWHLPLYGPEFGDDEFARDEMGEEVWTRAALISSARCARVSYLTHDGKRDVDEDIRLAHRLATSRHLSPFEHAATPSNDPGRQANLHGWEQLRYSIESFVIEAQ